MRLWHEALISQLPRPQLWGNIENAAPCVAMAGAESMRQWSMFLPIRPIVSMPIIA